ncbi:aldo/keto reductase, partial [Paraburkholderia sp. BR14261]
KSVTPGQLALAWLLKQGDDLVPIPGTKRRQYLEENVNAASVRLTPADLDHIRSFLGGHQTAGTRYLPPMLSHLDR